MEGIMEVIQSTPQEQLLERIVEETDIPVPRVMEEIIKVAKHGPQRVHR